MSHTLPSAREVQSELSQVVRIIGFFRLAPGAQPEEPEGQEARHLVEALGRVMGRKRKPFGMAGD